MTAETNSNTDASSGTTRPGTDPDNFGPGGVIGQLPDQCDPTLGEGEIPGEQLQRLRKCLEDAQRKQKEADSDVQRFTAQVTALSSFSDEFENIVAEYEKAYGDKKKIQKDFEDFKIATISGLEELLDQATRNRIATAVKPLQEEIVDLEGDGTKDQYGKPVLGKIGIEEKKLVQAKLDLAEAIAEREKAKTRFESWRKAVASITSRHTTLKDLQNKIDEAANEPAFAYWLVSDSVSEVPDKDNFTSMLKGPVQVLPVETDKGFRATLLRFWSEFNAAIKKVQDLDGAIKGSEEALKSMKARLDDAKKNLKARVRVLLSKIEVTPPGGGGADIDS